MGGIVEEVQADRNHVHPALRGRGRGALTTRVRVVPVGNTLTLGASRLALVRFAAQAREGRERCTGGATVRLPGPTAQTALITALCGPPRFPIAALRGPADLGRAMNPYPHLADAAWLRFAIVGADILAVVVTVRLCSVLAAWWRTLHAPRSVPATVRPPGRQRARR